MSIPIGYVVPENWHGVYVSSPADLAYLGLETIKGMLHYWGYFLEQAVADANFCRTRSEALKDATPMNLKKLGGQSDKLKYVDGKVPHLERVTSNGDAVPVDEIFRRGASCDTTFNCCGWCRYAFQEYHSAGETVSRACSLMMEELRTNLPLYTDTPCELANGSQAFINTCALYLASEAAEAARMEGEIWERMEILRAAAAASSSSALAVDKPPLPMARLDDWFEKGAEVYCVEDWRGADLHLVPCTVQEVEPHFGRYVTAVSLPEMAEGSKSSEQAERRHFKYDMRSPFIMLRTEREYFRRDPHFFDLWLLVAQCMPNIEFNMRIYKEAVLA